MCISSKNVLCVFPGKQEAVEATLVALEVVAEPLKSMATILVDVCAYAGELFWMHRHILSEGQYETAGLPDRQAASSVLHRQAPAAYLPKLHSKHTDPNHCQGHRHIKTYCLNYWR